MQRSFPLLSATFFLLALSFGAQATTWTVSNNPNKPAQYTSLQTAIDSAAIGDTLLISGSPTGYGTINLSKQLHLIGEGIGSSVDNPTLSSFYLRHDDATSNASGSTLEGLDMTTLYVGYNGSSPLEDVSIERCEMSSIYLGYYVNNVSGQPKSIDIDQCHIRQYAIFQDNYWFDGNPAGNGLQDIVFENCVFDGISSYHLDNVGDCNGELEIRNCMFLSTSQGLMSSSQTLSEVVFENCLFFGTQFSNNVNITNCLFNNCLAFQGDDTLPPGDEAANNTGSNNLSATDPLFVSYNPTPENFSWDHDYTLQEGSPAIGAGLDGVDIGIGGGSISSFDGNLPHTPRGPVVTSINLPVTAVAVGGTLQINVSAESRD